MFRKKGNKALGIAVVISLVSVWALANQSANSSNDANVKDCPHGVEVIGFDPHAFARCKDAPSPAED